MPKTTISECLTLTETSECLRLANKAYILQGLATPRCESCSHRDTCNGLDECTHERRTPWHDLQDTRVFRADVDGSLMGTVSCVFEDPFIGLPCGELFADQIVSCFGPRRVLAELTCIAAAGKTPGLLIPRMLRFARDWALERGVDAVVGCCHPHHVDFWRGFLCAVFPEPERVRFASHAENAEAVFGYMTRESVTEYTSRLRQRRLQR